MSRALDDFKEQLIKTGLTSEHVELLAKQSLDNIPSVKRSVIAAVVIAGIKALLVFA